MPWGLRRFQHEGHLHFITFSCYRRQSFLNSEARYLFEHALDRVRRRYSWRIFGYVVMPEHVHLLVNEPESKSLATAIKALKLSISNVKGGRFWQERYYDFNVWSDRKKIEKLRYIHRNPVKRGLVETPEQWVWSSYIHYQTGARGIVEIESHWKDWKRWEAGHTNNPG